MNTSCKSLSLSFAFPSTQLDPRYLASRSDHPFPPIYHSACQGKAGFNVKPFGSWRNAPADAYIVGLKELPEGEDGPLPHTHIFFAHCYKNQGGWTDILGRFDAGKGTILDLEFLNDAQGRRVAAFGYHAGFAGAAIGVDDWCQQKLHPDQPLPAYKPFPNEHELIAYIKERLGRAGNDGYFCPLFPRQSLLMLND